MNASRTRAPLSQGVSTISAPNRKNVIAWKTALTFSLKTLNASGMSCSATASATPGDEGGDQAVAPGASASPYASSASPSAYTPS